MYIHMYAHMYDVCVDESDKGGQAQRERTTRNNTRKRKIATSKKKERGRY